MSFKYLAKRIGVAILTLIAVIVVMFFVLRIMPGDILEPMTREEANKFGITYEEARTRVANRYNYDPNESLLIQFEVYVTALVKGDLGTSMINPNNTVTAILANAMPWTLFVVSISLILSFIIGVKLGALMAIRKGFVNNIITFYVTIVSTLPSYIVALLLSLIFVYTLKLFPMAGVYSIGLKPGFNLAFIWDVIWHALLPIVTYVITSTGGWIIQMKGTSISTLGEDYVFAAKARGLSEGIIRKKYMRKNAMIPLITTLAMAFGGMVGGSPLIESQFNYMGMGMYVSKAMNERDFTLYQGLLLCISVSVVIANLIADLLYVKLDPRIKMG